MWVLWTVPIVSIHFGAGVTIKNDNLIGISKGCVNDEKPIILSDNNYPVRHLLFGHYSSSQCASIMFAMSTKVLPSSLSSAKFSLSPTSKNTPSVDSIPASSCIFTGKRPQSLSILYALSLLIHSSLSSFNRSHNTPRQQYPSSSRREPVVCGYSPLRRAATHLSLMSCFISFP